MQAIGRRPTTIAVTLSGRGDGGAELRVGDDGHLERRRDSAEAFEERARPLSGRVEVDRTRGRDDRPSSALPAYAIR